MTALGRWIRRGGLGMLFVAGLSAFASYANAAEVHVLLAIALEGASKGLAEDFQRQTGNTVRYTIAPAGVIKEAAISGPPADIAIVIRNELKDLAARGKVAADTQTDVANAGVGVAVRKGGPMPDISTPEKFKEALLQTHTLIYIDPVTGGASGVHLVKVLARLGIADAVKAKSLLFIKVPEAMTRIAAGTGPELAVLTTTVIVSEPRLQLVGPLPGDLQTATTYSGAVTSSPLQPEAARAFLKFLVQPQAQARLKAAGFDPPQ